MTTKTISTGAEVYKNLLKEYGKAIGPVALTGGALAAAVFTADYLIQEVIPEMQAQQDRNTGNFVDVDYSTE